MQTRWARGFVLAREAAFNSAKSLCGKVCSRGGLHDKPRHELVDTGGQDRWPNSRLTGRQRRDKRAHPRLVSLRAGDQFSARSACLRPAHERRAFEPTAPEPGVLSHRPPLFSAAASPSHGSVRRERACLTASAHRAATIGVTMVGSPRPPVATIPAAVPVRWRPVPVTASRYRHRGDGHR